MTDIFGDLSDWGGVIRKIGQFRQEGTLHEHQDGLIRVLRYRFNWRLRQASLEAVQDVKTPSRQLLDVVISIVRDESVEMELRLLAGNAVNHMMWRSRNQAGGEELRVTAGRAAGGILSLTQAPVLRLAVEQWLRWDSRGQGIESSAGPRDDNRDSPLNPREQSQRSGPAGVGRRVLAGGVMTSPGV